MKVDLVGKVALVTGAGRGIGRAIAGALAENGAIVLGADIQFEVVEPAPSNALHPSQTQTGETFPSSMPQSGKGFPSSMPQSGKGFPSYTTDDGAIRPVEMDVTSTEAVEAMVQEVRDEFGRLDILVNNAGVNTLQHRVPIEQFPEEEWNRLLEVDLTGLYRVSKAFAPLMLPQGSGRIINIASVAGLAPLRLQCAFVAAKAGVVNLTRAMALELGSRGVLVNCIAPGSILTEGTRQLFYGEDGKFRDSMQTMLAHIPVGRPGFVEEVAHAALFLAAPESSYINGAILTVDGGWTAGYLREF